MEKDGAIQEQRGAKKRENNGSPGGDDPFDGKLKIKERYDTGRAQVREENIEVPAAVPAGGFFLLMQLREGKEKKQNPRKDGGQPPPPELPRVTPAETGQQNHREPHPTPHLRSLSH